jgi:hypothetical protein
MTPQSCSLLEKGTKGHRYEYLKVCFLAFLNSCSTVVNYLTYVPMSLVPVVIACEDSGKSRGKT